VSSTGGPGGGVMPVRSSSILEGSSPLDDVLFKSWFNTFGTVFSPSYEEERNSW